eukprot:389515_1
MSAVQLSPKWISLHSHPFTNNPCINPVSITVPTGIDKDNYIVISCGTFGNGKNSIQKYDFNTDKWSTIDDLNDFNDVSSWTCASLDAQKQTIFLLYGNQLTQIALNSNQLCNNNLNTTVHFTSTSKCITVNNSLFVVGGTENNSILKWNSENKTFIKFSDMYNKKNIGLFGIICNNKNNSLLLFGGRDYDDDGWVDYILEFNINTKQWNKLPISLPKKMDHICCTMAINNKYVLLFGGRDDTYGGCDGIYIYSLKYKTITQSKIKCPSEGIFSCITVNDNIKDEKLVFGYVRQHWVTCAI